MRRNRPVTKAWVHVSVVAPMVAWLWMPMAAAAHTRARPTPDSIWTAWNVDPLISMGMLFGSWIYLRGVVALWRSVGVDRGIRRWQVWSFTGGMVLLVIALISPLDALGGALFSAHMVQHLLLFLVAPMLLALSRPNVAIPWALPVASRKPFLVWAHRQPVIRGFQSIWSNPIVVWVTFCTVLWIWHVPAMYDAALRSDLVHSIEHVSFLLGAFVFWSYLIQTRQHRRVKNGLTVLFVFTTTVQSGLLGAILTFAGVTLYDGHAPFTEAWGLSVLEDQQLAGVLMWIPMGMWFTITTLVVFVAWLRDAERSVQQWETAAERRPTGTPRVRPTAAPGAQG